MEKHTENPRKQKGKKNGIIFLAVIAVLLTAAVAAAVYGVTTYHVIEGKLYAKDAEVLNLREEEIKPGHYDKLQEKMPDCEIQWNIPFQGGFLPSDITEITVSELTETDVALLNYAQDLTCVNAAGCRDYEALNLLRQNRPEVEVKYTVAFSGGTYDWDEEHLVLNSVNQEDIQLLDYLPRLKTVVITAGSYDPQTVDALRESVQSAGLEFGAMFAGQTYTTAEESLQIAGIGDMDLEMLSYFKQLKNLHLTDPQAAPEKVFALQEKFPNVAVSWEVTLGNQSFDRTATEVDLTTVEVTDLAEVEQKMAYLPELKQVTFGVCGVDNPDWGNSRSKLTASPIKNEDMAAYRDRVRDSYKVVWTVRLGPSIALATDKDNFMPNHFGVGQLPDSYAYNLRYCEEMVCLDVGHMTLTDISFVEYMPNLKYLILAWTEVQYIEPIRTCKNLVFLELDNSCIRDISPLVGCTALEDLNLGNTWCDITPLKEMPWLKNVYMILRGNAGVVGMALPDTRVVTSNDPDVATVGYGWRRLPNYYAMRDCLHVPYMN